MGGRTEHAPDARDDGRLDEPLAVEPLDKAELDLDPVDVQVKLRVVAVVGVVLGEQGAVGLVLAVVLGPKLEALVGRPAARAGRSRSSSSGDLGRLDRRRVCLASCVRRREVRARLRPARDEHVVERDGRREQVWDEGRLE